MCWGFGCQRLNKTVNPPVVAADNGANIFSSAATAGSGGASSLWVLQSRLGRLGTTRGRGCSAAAEAAPVWSSERLFATNTDKERRLLNYPLNIHIYTPPNICPAESVPMTILDRAILAREMICIPV